MIYYNIRSLNIIIYSIWQNLPGVFIPVFVLNTYIREVKSVCGDGI